jgi:hypothetical protein
MEVLLKFWTILINNDDNINNHDVCMRCGGKQQIEHNSLREQTAYHTNRTTVIKQLLLEVLLIMISIQHRHRHRHRREPK